MMRFPSWLAQYVAGLRALLVFTLLTGIGYPLVITGVAQLPGLRHHAGGSFATAPGGAVVGSELIGQSFVDLEGDPVQHYFQSRPSAAGEAGYDPTATSASNLGPEDIEDTPGRLSLLTQVCRRSLAVARLEGVDGRRPYCTPDGVGAVLRVFHGPEGVVTRVVSVNQLCPAVPFLDKYQGVQVECAAAGEDYRAGAAIPVRGGAPDPPMVPADAVTASGSGLDPHISLAYARLQVRRVARERGAAEAAVWRLVGTHTSERALGFMGEPAVHVLRLNLALDATFPRRT